MTPQASRKVVEPSPRVDWKSHLQEAEKSSARPERLTTEAVRAERLRMLRAQDPVLDAAIDELDLDLLD